GIAGKGAIVAARTFGESAAGQIEGVDGEMFRQRLHIEAPGERISHEAMNQQQRRSRSGGPEAPIHAIDGDETFLRASNFSDLWNALELWRWQHGRRVQPRRMRSTSRLVDIASVAWGSRDSPVFLFCTRVSSPSGVASRRQLFHFLRLHFEIAD